MRQHIFSVSIVLINNQLWQADKKGKEPATKNNATATLTENAKQKNVAPADTAKTVKLIFTGYEEGDYAHLLFSETGTNRPYDFGHPEDNNLNNIPIVIKNSNTSFGYKENSNMKGAKFMADIVYKTTDTYDKNGHPIIGKEWRIASLRKDE